MDTKVLFTTSRDIHAKHGVLNIGKYTIEPIPCSEDRETDMRRCRSAY